MVHPYWHLEAHIDLEAMMLQRPEQRAYLARYGRQAYFDTGRSIPEIEEAVAAIASVVRAENALNSTKETQG